LEPRGGFLRLRRGADGENAAGITDELGNGYAATSAERGFCLGGTPRPAQGPASVARQAGEQAANQRRPFRRRESKFLSLPTTKERWIWKIEQLTAKAEKGDAKAQLNLGWRYFKGEGVPKDSTEAVKWFRPAAEQGDAVAQGSLGQCYYEGWGVVKNSTEAVKWLRPAAEQGYAEAQCYLGLCYRDGEGVPKDYVQAYKWFNPAAAQGHAGAKENRDRLEKQMSPEQIAEGQRLCREFKP
jgi:TPR repeat protein